MTDYYKYPEHYIVLPADRAEKAAQPSTCIFCERGIQKKPGKAIWATHEKYEQYFAELAQKLAQKQDSDE